MILLAKSAIIFVLMILTWLQIAPRVGGLLTPAVQVITFAPPKAIGDQMPDFARLVSHEFKSTDLDAMRKPETCALLYFFDPACDACAEAAPAWAGLKSVGDGTASVPIIWFDIGEEPAAAITFVLKHGIVASTYHIDAAVRDDVGVIGVPTAWGVVNDTIHYLAQGALQTLPNRVDLSWCRPNH
jgi:hypothetical protein